MPEQNTKDLNTREAPVEVQTGPDLTVSALMDDCRRSVFSHNSSVNKQTFSAALHFSQVQSNHVTHTDKLKCESRSHEHCANKETTTTQTVSGHNKNKEQCKVEKQMNVQIKIDFFLSFFFSLQLTCLCHCFDAQVSVYKFWLTSPPMDQWSPFPVPSQSGAGVDRGQLRRGQRGQRVQMM